jgi:hypothetical protein
MRNTQSEYRAKEGLTFVLEPFLHPVVCGVAKREFVEDVGEDLCEQRVLNVKHRFPVAKVEVSQGSVVSANGSGDGGRRGHGGTQRIGSRCSRSLWPRTYSWSTGSPRTTEHLTAPHWHSRRLTASAGVRSPFAISRYSLIFFFSRFCWKHGQLNPVQPQQGHTLFTLPRHLTLSTRTSSLPSLIGEDDWKKHGLDVGWAGLILCLMWEGARGTTSKWSTYLGTEVCILVASC